MSIEKEVQSRCQNACELCGASNPSHLYLVPPATKPSLDKVLMLCDTCHQQIIHPETIVPNHWRCLNDTMWSEVPAVKVMAWRMLNRLSGEGWPMDLLELLYLDEDTLSWAKSTGEGVSDEDIIKHVDCNGVALQTGDNVILTQTLQVKGASFDAKRGTPVRGISLVADNPEQIEGRVNGQKIVILTKYVKKS